MLLRIEEVSGALGLPRPHTFQVKMKDEFSAKQLQKSTWNAFQKRVLKKFFNWMFLFDSLNYFGGVNNFAWRVHCRAHFYQISSGWLCESVKRICHHLVAHSCPFTVQLWTCDKYNTSGNVVRMYTAFLFDLKLQDCFMVLNPDSILFDVKKERLGTIHKTDAVYLFKVGSLLKALCSRLPTVNSQSSWFCFVCVLFSPFWWTHSATNTYMYFFSSQVLLGA